MSITILKAGFQDLIQDLGRNGYTHMGISPTGAADNISFRIGNLLLGNDINDPGIEITLFGGSYYFNTDAIIALSGSVFTSAIDGNMIPFFKPIVVKSGQTLTIGSTTNGARCYLAIRGGFQVPYILDSSSTHLLSNAGGFNGRNLKKNDEIICSSSDDMGIKNNIKFNMDDDRSILRVTRGLQYDLFDDANKKLFFSEEFTVSNNSNRMGLRIRGPKIYNKTTKDILTEGLPLGAIQITGDGDSIISFVDHQTTGGYPKITNVITADLHKVGQLKPGDKFMFKLVSFHEAETLYFNQEKSLKI